MEEWTDGFIEEVERMDGDGKAQGLLDPKLVLLLPFHCLTSFAHNQLMNIFG